MSATIVWMYPRSMPENDFSGVEPPIRAVVELWCRRGFHITGDRTGSIGTEPDSLPWLWISTFHRSPDERTGLMMDLDCWASCCAVRSCWAGCSMKAWGMSAVAALARVERWHYLQESSNRIQIKNADLWLRVCLIPVCMSPSWLV